MTFLNSLLQVDKNFKEAWDNINLGRNICINGVDDSGKSYFISSMAEKLQRAVFILTYNDIQAKSIYDDLKFFVKDKFDIQLFISRPHLLYNIDAGTQDIFSTRQEAIVAAIVSEKPIIVASIEAMSTCLIPKQAYEKTIIKLRVGDTVNFQDLTKKIIAAGYSMVDMVQTKGQASKKGGIFDICPLGLNSGIRIEFFDDEIDSIRMFDIDTQRSFDNLQSIDIYPSRELLFDKDIKEKACIELKKDIENMAARIKERKQREGFMQKFSHVLENIENDIHMDGIEKYIGYFYDTTDTILDYMPKDTVVFIDEPNRIKQRYDNLKVEFDEMIKSIIEKGTFLDRYYDVIRNYDDIVMTCAEKPCSVLNYLKQDVKRIRIDTNLSMESKTISSFYGKLNELAEKVKENKEKLYASILVCSTEAQAKRLIDELQEYNISIYIYDKNNDVENYLNPTVYIGGIHRGFEVGFSNTTENSANKLKGICIINYSEIFGLSSKKKSKRKVKKADRIKTYGDLKIGDYVVHINHGIGIYTGIEQLTIDNIRKDYLKIAYQGGDSIYVPTNQLDMLQKYVGAGEKEPKINKLGGSDWQKVKNRVKKSVEDIALKLIELYAQREASRGFEFSEDNVWQTQFEDMFPYEETDDQLQSIKEIKQDMESHKVMDRLLCGDVGYGKTEVAMRAAFKAVQDGKQVAYLVPTTVLAQQQYRSFCTRFKEFPINIEVMSRFRTSSQQKQITEKLKIGDVDILIGTHRLLQKDINFKDVGLVIVDEEQRFGVKHKEKLKELKKNVDVLTLTATPIPRTLHMSMIGIRDISVIEEPPQDRYPVQTYVLEYDGEFIKDAIIKELSRGGQVFYVYNRVETINECEGRLKKLLPDARICTAHGQMSPAQLEDRIMEFLEGEYDIIVCTTIIETGIDMPNVNTLIVENADRMGLSQLYQLRGRVGRSNKIAYAYFTYKKDKILSEVAEKRLQAIKEFTEFGSGFRIALRDLEIRGAGNILGAEQHGHMEAVGYDLYCSLLEQAVARLKGNRVEELPETTLDLAVDAYISSNYVKDEIQKIQMYKKVAAIENDGDVILIQEEFVDRFGDIPKPVENLIQIALIKSMAKKLYIEAINQLSNSIIIKFSSSEKFDVNMVSRLIDKYKNSIKFENGTKPSLRFNLKDKKPDNIFKSIKKVLKDMV